MTKIRCRIFKNKKQCESIHETNDPVADGASFICRHHPRSVQKQAVGQTYDPVKDEKDADLSFQDTQFDGDLDSSGAPDSTQHIPGARGTDA